MSNIEISIKKSPIHILWTGVRSFIKIIIKMLQNIRTTIINTPKKVKIVMGVSLIVLVVTIYILIAIEDDETRDPREDARRIGSQVRDAIKVPLELTEPGMKFTIRLIHMQGYNETLKTKDIELANDLKDVVETIIDNHEDENDSFTVVAKKIKKDADNILERKDNTNPEEDSSDAEGFTVEYYPGTGDTFDLTDTTKSGYLRCESERDALVDTNPSSLAINDYYNEGGDPMNRDTIISNIGETEELLDLYNCHTKNTCGYDIDISGEYECPSPKILSINAGLIECLEEGCDESTCCISPDENPDENLFICTTEEQTAISDAGDDSDALETAQEDCARRICLNLDIQSDDSQMDICLPEVRSIQRNLENLLTIELDAIMAEILTEIAILESKNLAEEDTITEIQRTASELENFSLPDPPSNTYLQLLSNSESMGYTNFKDYLNQLLNIVKIINHRTWPIYSDYISEKAEDNIICYNDKETMENCLQGYFPRTGDVVNGNPVTITEEDWNRECERQFEVDTQGDENEVIDQLISPDNPRSKQLNRLLLDYQNTEVLRDDICSGSMCNNQQDCIMGNSPQRTVANNFGNMINNFKQYSIDPSASDLLFEGDNTMYNIYTTYFKTIE